MRLLPVVAQLVVQAVGAEAAVDARQWRRRLLRRARLLPPISLAEQIVFARRRARVAAVRTHFGRVSGRLAKDGAGRSPGCPSSPVAPCRCRWPVPRIQ